MKKILLFLSGALLCATLSTQKASAQDHKFFSLGVKAGVNVSSISGLANIQAAMESGFTGGLFAEIRPFSFLGVGAEVLYSGNGFNIKDDAGLFNFTVNYGTIDIPIMAKIYLTPNFSVNAGIMPTFLAGTQVEGLETELKMNSVGVSLPVGISYQFDFGLLIDARYKFGLTDINSVSEIGTTTHAFDQHLKGEGFSFTVGWRF